MTVRTRRIKVVVMLFLLMLDPGHPFMTAFAEGSTSVKCVIIVVNGFT